MTKWQLLRILLFPFSPTLAYHMTLTLTPNAHDYLNGVYNVLFTLALWIAIYFIGELDEK
ncbi:potassium transporter Trk [Streptococcus fryi]